MAGWRYEASWWMLGVRLDKLSTSLVKACYTQSLRAAVSSRGRCPRLWPVEKVKEKAMNIASFFFCLNIHFSPIFRGSFCCTEEAGGLLPHDVIFQPIPQTVREVTCWQGMVKLPFSVWKDYIKAGWQDSECFHYTFSLRLPHLLPQHGKLSQQHWQTTGTARGQHTAL